MARSPKSPSADTTPAAVKRAVFASSSPRYASLADALVRDIDSGRYPVGALLPPEVELTRQYGVSRHTVREATRKLVDMGLVSRHPGVGTRVQRKNGEARYVASLTSIDDLIHYTQETTLEVLEDKFVAAEGELRDLLRCKEGQRWLMLRTLRYPLWTKEPISYTEIYVPPHYEELRSFLIKGKSVTIFNLLEDHYNERIVEVQQDVSAVVTSQDNARLLHTRAGAPALHIVRYYVGSSERLLAMSINTYPAKRFQFSTRWRLEWAKTNG